MELLAAILLALVLWIWWLPIFKPYWGFRRPRSPLDGDDDPDGF